MKERHPHFPTAYRWSLGAGILASVVTPLVHRLVTLPQPPAFDWLLPFSIGLVLWAVALGGWRRLNQHKEGVVAGLLIPTVLVAVWAALGLAGDEGAGFLETILMPALTGILASLLTATLLYGIASDMHHIARTRHKRPVVLPHIAEPTPKKPPTDDLKPLAFVLGLLGIIYVVDWWFRNSE